MSNNARSHKRPHEELSENKCTNKRIKYTDVPYTPPANKNEFVYMGNSSLSATCYNAFESVLYDIFFSFDEKLCLYSYRNLSLEYCFYA